jgi:hypothetical protein
MTTTDPTKTQQVASVVENIAGVIGTAAMAANPEAQIAVGLIAAIAHALSVHSQKPAPAIVAAVADTVAQVSHNANTQATAQAVSVAAHAMDAQQVAVGATSLSPAQTVDAGAQGGMDDPTPVPVQVPSTSHVSALPLGMSLNNPGNIMLEHPDRYQWDGEVTPGSDPRLVTFAHTYFGLRALSKLLTNYYTGAAKCDTIRKVITRFAPSTENDTNQYIKNVAAFCGVGPDVAVNLLSTTVMVKLMQAIIKQEQGLTPWTFNDMYAVVRMTPEDVAVATNDANAAQS